MEFDEDQMDAPSSVPWDYYYAKRTLSTIAAGRVRVFLTLAAILGIVYYFLATSFGQSVPIVVTSLIVGSTYLSVIMYPLFYQFFMLRYSIIDGTESGRFKIRTLKELKSLEGYYVIMIGLSQLREKSTELEKGLQEIRDLEETITSPKLLRNVSLAVISSAGGISGIASILLNGSFLGSISQLTNLVGSLQATIIGLIVSIPIFLLMIIVVEPFVQGFRRSAKYVEEHRSLRTGLKDAMKHARETISPPVETNSAK
jgi:hypothetical protein